MPHTGIPPPLRKIGLTGRRLAPIVGVNESTLRRWWREGTMPNGVAEWLDGLAHEVDQFRRGADHWLVQERKEK